MLQGRDGVLEGPQERRINGVLGWRQSRGKVPAVLGLACKGPIWQISCSRRGAGGAPGLGEAKALGFCQAGTGEFSSRRALPAGCRGGGNVGRAGREMLWIGSKAASVLITKDRFMLSVKYQGGHENYEYY